MEEFTYQKKYRIGLSDVDFTKKLKVGTLFGYFQDIASQAVENLGIGIDALAEEFNVAWVLMRIRVEIDRNPSWNEEITVETWPQPAKRFEFDRDFLVRDAAGHIIARAVSTWVIFDIHTREIKRSDTIPARYPLLGRDRAIECRLGKLKSSGEPDVVYKKVIGYSDVDFNGHLNNSKYIDFIMDCFPVESHKSHCVKSIEVHYINEALPGETLVLLKDVTAYNAGLIYVEGIKEKDQKTVFKAQLEIAAR